MASVVFLNRYLKFLDRDNGLRRAIPDANDVIVYADEFFLIGQIESVQIPE